MRVQLSAYLNQSGKTQSRNLKVLVGIVACLGLMLFGLTSPAVAGPLKIHSGATAMQETNLAQTNKAIALRYAEEGWGNQPGWEKVWDELVAPDYVLHFNSFPQPIVGLAANKQFSEGLFQGFPDIKNTIEDVVAEGDLVVYRSKLQGTHTGNFLGTPPTGKPVEAEDFTQLRFKEGKIVESWYQTNLLAVMQQLGLAPES